MDIKEIEVEIDKLEQAETNYQNCSKLAVLYTIKDHFKSKKTAGYSYSASEFLLAVNEAPLDEALKVIDEHMEAIKLLYPKEYSAVIRKLKSEF